MGSLAHKINIIFPCTEQIRWCGVYSKCLFFPPLELHSLVPLQRPPLETTQPDPGYAPSGAEQADFKEGEGGGGEELSAQLQNCPQAEKGGKKHRRRLVM